MQVADIAAGSLAAVRVFESFGIDYCCGGKRPAGGGLRGKGAGRRRSSTSFGLGYAAEARRRARLEYRSAPRIGRAYGEHSSRIPEAGTGPARRSGGEGGKGVQGSRAGVAGLQAFEGLASELLMHLRKEETILFPAIESSEDALGAGQPALPRLPFGTVANPIRVLEMEHEDAGNALARLREITHNYAVPEFACVTYKAMLTGLRELEEDLHMHIHLENNILFPRTLKLTASKAA